MPRPTDDSGPYPVGEKLLLGIRKRDYDDDEKNLELFAECVTGQNPDQLPETIRKGIPVEWWQETYDVVNPFGDTRSTGLKSVWLIDLRTNTISLWKKDGYSSLSLDLARQRKLDITDFKALASPNPTDRIGQLSLNETWEPDFECISKMKSFPSRVLRDFVHVWRHLLRRQQNDTTFSRLAHAVVSISALKFSVSARTGFDHSPERPWVWIYDLPQWDISNNSNNNLFRSGASWFVLTQDVLHGVELIRQHIKSRNTDEKALAGSGIYAILTLRHIVLCRVRDTDLEWARPEVFFNSETLSDRAVDIILWAAHSSPASTLLHKLPIEIKDTIFQKSCTNPIEAAILDCQLGFPCDWKDWDIRVELEERKRKRPSHSPPEWQIRLEGGFTGVSYKMRRRAP